MIDCLGILGASADLLHGNGALGIGGFAGVAGLAAAAWVEWGFVEVQGEAGFLGGDCEDFGGGGEVVVGAEVAELCGWHGVWDWGRLGGWSEMRSVNGVRAWSEM